VPDDAESGGLRRWRLVRAGRDAVPSSVRRFMRRARRRRLRAAAPWGIGLGVILLAAVIAWVILRTSVFGVESVRVTGVAILTADQVVAVAAVPDGVPLATVDIDGIRDRVGRLLPVASVRVERDWPHTVTIAVTERAGVAAVPQDKGFIVIDSAGVGFLTADERPSGLPLVRLEQPGPDNPETVAALAVLSVLSPQLKGELVTLVVEGPARIRLELRQNRVVLWGDTSDGDVKSKVATALLSRSWKTIDVTAPEVVTIS